MVTPTMTQTFVGWVDKLSDLLMTANSGGAGSDQNSQVDLKAKQKSYRALFLRRLLRLVRGGRLARSLSGVPPSLAGSSNPFLVCKVSLSAAKVSSS
jgi:hypothetical protein